MAFDAHANFGVSSVAVAPSPATTGTSLTVATGEGTRFPAAPFNVTLAPAGVLATPANAEIVRVTARSGDVLTITRAQEGSVARAVVVGDLCVASITAKALQDIETGAARTDVTNIFTASQRMDMQNPAWLLFDWSQGPDAKLFKIVNTAQTLQLNAQNDGQTVTYSSTQFERSGNARIYGNLYEKQRTTPLGHWIDLPQSQSSFMANTGTWSITGSTIYTYAYTAIGKTLLVALVVNSTSVSGSPVELRLALPAGFTCASNIVTYPILSEAGVFAAGSAVQGTPGAGYLSIYKANAAAFTTTTNATNVYFCAPMRVQ
jgi:hypothetical protein